MNFLRSAICVGLLGIFGAAQAGTLWGTDTSGDLYTIDTTTATATLVGNHGLNLESLAYDDSVNMLYGASSDGQLYSLNQSTGAATLIGNTGLGNIEGMDFAGPGLLYGFDFSDTPTIYTIDTTTAVATTYVTADAAVGPVRAFAFNPGDTLALMAADAPVYQSLIGMDPSGATTNFGSLGTEGVYGMDFIGNDMFGLGGDGELWSIDPSSGAKSLIGNTGGQFWLDTAAMNPVPEPATVAVIGLGLAALARRRKKA